MMRLARILRDYNETGAVNSLIALWGFVDDHAFLTKSGHVGFVYNVRGTDAEGLTHEERKVIVHQFEAARRCRHLLGARSDGGLGPRLENLLDDVNRALGTNLADAHGEQAIQERVSWNGCLEARQRSKVAVRIVAHAGERHVGQGAPITEKGHIQKTSRGEPRLLSPITLTDAYLF